VQNLGTLLLNVDQAFGHETLLAVASQQSKPRAQEEPTRANARLWQGYRCKTREFAFP
jgi:hypothetical protein